MMSELTPTVTVEDIRKLALPLGTRVVTGEGVLNRVVSWASVIFMDEHFNHKSVQPGEVLLVAPPENFGRSTITDVDIVRWAADIQAAAVVTSLAPSPTAVAEAKAYNISLMTLPVGARVRQVERSVISLLVDRKGQLERRGTQIYRQLTQISSRNEGMAEIVTAMARLTNKAIVVQDKRLRPIEHTVQPQLVAAWEDIDQFLRKMEHIPPALQDRHRVADLDNPVIRQSLPIIGLARFVAPIITNSIGRGFLSVIGQESDLDDLDRLVAEHGAGACALEMAKLKAVSETEKRLRGTFLDRLLIGDVSQQEAVRQGERFEHDMTQIHVAIVLSWRGENPPSMRRLETMVNTIIDSQRAKALVWQREKEREIVVFHATDRENPIDTSLRLTEIFAREINRQYPNNHVAIGLGQSAKDISAWRSSYRDAVQAMELAVRLQTDTPLYIGDLGVYQLILSLNDREKLIEFCNRTLGALIDYDTHQKADLLKTLEAFFTCHGNLSSTAEMLIVHRNTLLYRMNRINEIAEIDLSRPETRLALHLALTIRRLLSLN
ncbi:MAG: helix-turn-helix domain-containing protein [Anaerolineae bacterium]|nr:helix-turn-helix domain-containing protein [Anaerolineae bacterium]MDW8173093.1 helix-turn-helix domain-containing protein [Anaerolineae bacterium]